MSRNLDVHVDNNLVEKPLNSTWASFTYSDRVFNVDLSYQPESLHQKLGILKTPATTLVKMSVLADDETEKGILFGLLSRDNGRVTFQSHSISNRDVKVNSNGAKLMTNHVPNLMREVVVQLILQGKIDEITTSAVLSEGAIKTYDRILADERVHAEKKYLNDDKSLPYYMFSKI